MEKISPHARFLLYPVLDMSENRPKRATPKRYVKCFARNVKTVRVVTN